LCHYINYKETNKCNTASVITGEQTQAVFTEVKTDMTQTTLAHISSKNIQGYS